MPRYTIKGIDLESGLETSLVVDATSVQEAEQIAIRKGIKFKSIGWDGNAADGAPKPTSRRKSTVSGQVKSDLARFAGNVVLAVVIVVGLGGGWLASRSWRYHNDPVFRAEVDAELARDSEELMARMEARYRRAGVGWSLAEVERVWFGSQGWAWAHVTESPMGELEALATNDQMPWATMGVTGPKSNLRVIVFSARLDRGLGDAENQRRASVLVDAAQRIVGNERQLSGLFHSEIDGVMSPSLVSSDRMVPVGSCEVRFKMGVERGRTTVTVVVSPGLKTD